MKRRETRCCIFGVAIVYNDILFVPLESSDSNYLGQSSSSRVGCHPCCVHVFLTNSLQFNNRRPFVFHLTLVRSRRLRTTDIFRSLLKIWDHCHSLVLLIFFYHCCNFLNKWSTTKATISFFFSFQRNYSQITIIIIIIPSIIPRKKPIQRWCIA